MTKAGERATSKAEHVNGGAGYIIREPLITDEQRGEHCKMFNRIVVPAGSEIGYHEHHGDTETYYILEGSGIYMDNDVEMPLEAGDVFFCKDGEGHGIRNTGDGDIVFVALILKK